MRDWPDRPRRVGLIGTGWYGKCDLLQLLNVEPVEIVSLCDVDAKMLATAAELFQSRQPSGKRPQTYSDYRVMLGKKELDIVLVATPDHWHALPMTAAFHFDKLDVVWTHRSWGSSPDPDYPWAAVIYGDKGALKLSVNRYDFVPQGRGEKLHGEAVIELDKFPRDAADQKQWALELPVAAAIRGHMQNFLKAIDERSKPIADVEQGHISSAACILANLSQQLGRSLAWDPQTHTVLGDADATAQLKRKYREPWQHPAG